MPQSLVIVESPAKAKTISKYLGKTFKVLASYGHVRDLPAKQGSVDPQDNFNMVYQPIEKNIKHINKIADALKHTDSLFLATDPDREGEAIAWHMQQLLEARGVLKQQSVHRVVFHEITKKAIVQAIQDPRDISMNLVNAQQARRALDYLVGFNLSPLLWKKIRTGLSAGRVQSPALKMIVEREQAITKFKPKEYWTITANLMADTTPFKARLIQYQAKKVEQFTIHNKADAEQAVKDLTEAAQHQLIVVKITKRQKKRHPAAPFITSTLQQEAARKAGFSAQKTMRIAQQLYEGIDTDDGALGLITYMRTDSVQLAQEAIETIRAVIKKTYGSTYLPKTPRIYKTKSKNAQEAHEAIRPTDPTLLPEQIKASLSDDQFKLYELIWKRSIACQMISATIDSVSIDFSCGQDNAFRATGSTITMPGFIKLYQESTDDQPTKPTDDHSLPPMAEGDLIPLKDIVPSQHFTEPLPRFSEATLVKALEEHGIGRPSTYATIISTLQQRNYVQLEKKRFIPTDVGEVVSRFLNEYFKQYVDYGFTANLEDDLDAISRGEKKWVPLLQQFWQPFYDQVQAIDKTTKRSDVTTEATDQTCPQCQKPMVIRLGRRGRFMGCTGYPDCNYTKNINESEDASEPTVIEDRHCPKCNSTLVIKSGPYGKFIGCSSYPNCKHIEPLEKPQATGVSCPACKKGLLVTKRSRRGKIFYACETYPKCQYAIWYPPLAETCPTCQWPILMLKTTKKNGTEKTCPEKTCDFCIAVEPS